MKKIHFNYFSNGYTPYKTFQPLQGMELTLEVFTIIKPWKIPNEKNCRQRIPESSCAVKEAVAEASLYQLGMVAEKLCNLPE